MENNQNKKYLKEKILEKIKTGKVKMKPRLYFILKNAFILSIFLILIFFLIFLISFIYFHLRLSGVWYLPQFGKEWFFTFIKLLPWFLIFLSLILIFLSEILAKKFSFVWKKPIFYSLLGIIFIVAVGGIFIEKSALHPKLFLKSKEESLPLVAPIYKEFALPKFEKIHRGTVKEIKESGFLLEKPNGEVLNILIEKQNKIPFYKEIKIDDNLVIIGKRDDGKVKAFDIKIIKDDLRRVEKKLRPRPKGRLPLLEK